MGGRFARRSKIFVHKSVGLYCCDLDKAQSRFAACIRQLAREWSLPAQRARLAVYCFHECRHMLRRRELADAVAQVEDVRRTGF